MNRKEDMQEELVDLGVASLETKGGDPIVLNEPDRFSPPLELTE
ncbi:benenodin family lasso peptide [Brevundimonas sp.]|nr:benenodin family lasso peptide [Brevundimonas sp.]